MALLAAPAVSFVGMIRFRFEGSSGRVVPQSQSSAEDTPTGNAHETRESPRRKQNFRGACHTAPGLTIRISRVRCVAPPSYAICCHTAIPRPR